MCNRTQRESSKYVYIEIDSIIVHPQCRIPCSMYPYKLPSTNAVLVCESSMKDRDRILQRERAVSKAASRWKNIKFLSKGCAVIVLRPYVFEVKIRLWH